MTDRGRAGYGHLSTPYGGMLIAGTGRTVLAVKFGVPKRDVLRAVEALHRERGGRYTLRPDERAVETIAKQLTEYFAGRRERFDLDLDISHVTPFRREVLRATHAIPRGHVVTYGELARRVGRPAAFRAVGHTMATNPIPIIIPCHRVLGSNGSLTGFGGGLDMKRRLLALEGAALPV
jgi:methylated-DNA-[protein]-cysteine S-methyltransferase